MASHAASGSYLLGKNIQKGTSNIKGSATNLDAQVAERLYICIYVYMFVTVSYGHLGCGLEIVSVAIPVASSCSINLYNVLNSRFRLLPILRYTCGG